MAPLTKITLLTLLSTFLSATALEITPRDLILMRAGTQFITGPCTSDADCANGCCGFNSGKCAGAVVAQERDGGCGHGDAQPNANAAISLGFTPSSTAAAQAQAAGVSTAAAAAAAATGKQFITGACTSDADCANSCCGFNSGKCAGAIVAQQRDGGCGFGDAQPNANAAISLGFQPSGAAAANIKPTTTAAGAQAQAASTATAAAAAGAGENQAQSGNGQGKQFITGACTSDADCASGCCGFNSGKCAGAVVAQGRDGGCGFGDAAPNASAAIALGFQPTASAAA